MHGGTEIRPILASFASCLIYPWIHLNHSSIESLHELKSKLIAVSGSQGEYIPVSQLSLLLDVDETQTSVLLDILSDVSDTGADVRRLCSSGESELVDVHRLLLLLLVHFHLNRARESSDDHWPRSSSHQNYHHQLEPSSPLKLHAKSFASGSQSSQTMGVSDEHIQHETRRLADFLAAHVDDVLRLISDGDGSAPLSSQELARLSFLLTGAVAELAGGSDVTGRVRDALAPGQGTVQQGNGTLEDNYGSDNITGIMTNNSNGCSDICDVLIHGVHKVTVIRGEEEIGPAESVRIVDCHDSVIYILAPLKWAQVVSCTNSIVVLGAVGQSLRIEYSERLQVVAVTSHTVINTCHDCIVYTASNRPPLIVGDNRFVQLAPYNSGYDNLERHMELAGISASVNRWDSAVTLMPERPVFKHHPQQNLHVQNQLDHSKSVTLLPPEKIMPFVIPFKGGQGPLCGGAAAPLTRGASGDTLTGLLTQEFVDFCPCPFPLPQVYVDAWKSRMAGIATVKEAYKTAKLSPEQKQAFTSSVQSFFKEWLHHGGGMREVYDLAKVEKGLAQNNKQEQ